MTTNEAVAYLQNDWSVSWGGHLVVDENKKDRFLEALGMGITALHAQQEAEKNEPLTLKELQQMGGEPYYHVSLQGSKNHWVILEPFVADHLRDYHYGERWLAYRRPPTKQEG